MKGSIIFAGLLALVGCHVPEVFGEDCVLKKIPVVSADPSRNEVYVARTMAFEVQFRNENAPKPAEVFPEPLVTVRNLKTTKSCDIKDGKGIWSGKSVYMDTRGLVLVLNEYSGASDALIFYDLKTCHKLAEVDVSSKRWEISENRIRTGQHCVGNDVSSCRTVQELGLDDRCLVKDSQKTNSRLR